MTHAKMRGETAAVVRDLRNMSGVNNAADAQALRARVRLLQQAQVPDRKIAEALGAEHMRQLGMQLKAGSLVLPKVVASDRAPRADGGATALARALGGVVRARLGEPVVRGLDERLVGADAVRRQQREQALKARLREGNLEQRASMMARVPAIGRVALAVVDHAGNFARQASYKVQQRVEQAAAVMQRASADASKWRVAAQHTLPQPTMRLQTHGADAPGHVLYQRAVLLRATEPVMLRAEGRDHAAERHLGIVCEHAFALEPAFGDLLGCSEDAALALGVYGDEADLAAEYIASQDASLAPIATAIVAEQQLLAGGA